ncbi:GNAT family N-acetyltransferase [Flavobacterium sp. 3HN19-14]|uniref:GNAT family N-acetyltransferase n=1 Tax=Flavobacterium sp. 3HN19-14 TaxID=3448133 RepID=UPI003EE2AEA9
MAFENWKTERLTDILPEEFYNLIRKNKRHIEKTFPVTVDNCASFEKTLQFLGENIEKEESGEGYYFYLRNTETGNLIGYVCIKNINKSIFKCELAYFIDSEFEGKGIISKAVSQTLDFCFGELNMNKVFICTSLINKGSQRIATKHGFQQEGILREEFKSGYGVLEDIVYFGLLKKDYNER